MFRMVISMQKQPKQMIQSFRDQILKEETTGTKVGGGCDYFLPAHLLDKHNGKTRIVTTKYARTRSQEYKISHGYSN